MKFFNILFLMFVFTVFTLEAYASAALKITPHRVHIQSGDRVMPVNISNGSGKRKAYRVTMETRYMTPDGGSVVVDDKEPFSAIPLLRVSPRRVVLEDGERQTIRLQVKPKRVEAGDYFTHLKFTEVKIPLSLAEQEEAKKKQSGAGMSFKIEKAVNISVPITVARGKIDTDIKIVSAEKNGFKQGDHEFLDVNISRKGNGQGKGFFYGRFKANDSADNALLPIVINRVPLSLYRNLDELLLHLPFAGKDMNLKNGKIILTLHDGEGLNSPVIDTFTVDVP